MNLLTSIFIVLLSISCVENKPKSSIAKEALQPEITHNKKEIFDIDKPYLVTLEIDKTNKDEVSLITLIDIYDKEFLGSPHSNGLFVENITISLKETNNITLKDSIVKSPKILESQDPWGDGQVNWIKRNRTYTQKLTINNSEDFKVTGHIIFDMEPKKTKEDIKFIISQESGVITVKKVNTTVPFTK